MKNLEKYVTILENNNFSFKTKSLCSYLKGNRNIINEYKEAIVSFNLIPEADAEVYALMLSNYRLNGSFCSDLGKGALKLVNTYYCFETRKEAFSAYLTRVMPKTFNRWAKVLKELNEEQIKFEITNEQNLIKDLTLTEIENLLGFKVRIIS